MFRSDGALIAVAASLVLAACGGSSGGSDDGAAGGPGPAPAGPVLTAGVPGLVGDWLAIGCTAAGGQSFRNLVRATQVSGAAIRYATGVYRYAGTSCAGEGSLIGPSDIGSVTFTRAESDPTVAASWGLFAQITGMNSAVIWAKRRERVLCLLGDQTPSILPTLAAVAASLQTLPESACYDRL